MNCQNCDERLLDLLYGEIAGPEAEEARAHVRECASCGRSFAQLEAAHRLATQLPEPEPPRALDARILAAARQKVGAEPARPRAARAGDSDTAGLWAGILRWLGGFAMGPQVAMATIMLLVVAIGLWHLPGRRREPTAGGGTVVQPEDHGEAAPSATLEPAAPLDLDLDPRTGRLRARDDEGGGAAEQTAGRERPRGAQAEAPASPRSQAGGEVVNGPLAELAGTRTRQAANVPADVPAQARAGLPTRPAAGRNAVPLLEDDGDVAMGDAVMAQATGARQQGSAAPQQAPLPAPTEPAPTSTLDLRRTEGTTASQAPAPDTGAYTRGMDYYRRNDYAGAIRELNRVVADPSSGSLVPSALHHLARSHRSAGACRSAVPQYESLLRRFPAYGDAPRAMLELADCYRRVGRLSDARTMLLRAQRYQSVAPAAQRELMRVDQMERARRAPAPAADMVESEAGQ